MPQFIRWESRYGWTLRGCGKVAEKEVPPATVLERGDTGRVHTLMQECLDALPGHRDFLDFAAEIDAPLPERARRAARFST